MSGQFDMFGPPPPEPPVDVFHGWGKDPELFDRLNSLIQWEQHQMPSGIRMPRLECLYSHRPLVYRYSGVSYTARSMPRELWDLTERVSKVAEVPFNAVFCNLYRTGSDSIGWHADDEPSLGPASLVVIASLSLGARRAFQMKHRDGHVVSWSLGEGDLLIMREGAQSAWTHQVPKRKGVFSPRINLTFRKVRSR